MIQRISRWALVIVPGLFIVLNFLPSGMFVGAMIVLFAVILGIAVGVVLPIPSGFIAGQAEEQCRHDDQST